MGSFKHHSFLRHTAEEAFTLTTMAGAASQATWPPSYPGGHRVPKMFYATVPTMT